MRALIVTAAALALVACGREQPANETVAVNESAEVEAIGGNDTTAIDAATNQAAEMAADVDLTNLPANVDQGEEGDEPDNKAEANETGNSDD